MLQRWEIENIFASYYSRIISIISFFQSLIINYQINCQILYLHSEKFTSLSSILFSTRVQQFIVALKRIFPFTNIKIFSNKFLFFFFNPTPLLFHKNNEA